MYSISPCVYVGIFSYIYLEIALVMRRQNMLLWFIILVCGSKKPVLTGQIVTVGAGVLLVTLAIASDNKWRDTLDYIPFIRDVVSDTIKKSAARFVVSIHA